MLSILPAEILLFLVAQSFGGQPPWDLEKPIQIRGEVRRGELFEKPIGRGLYFRLRPDENGWNIEVGDRTEDFTRCVNTPFHGITSQQIEGWHFRNDDNTAARAPKELLTPGIGQKRWFDFVLTAEDQRRECHNLDGMLYINDDKNPEHIRAENDWGLTRSGRGYLSITGMTLGNLTPGQQAWIESLDFEAELSFTGALDLWMLPARYRIPKGFTGWVWVLYDVKGAPPAATQDGHYVLTIPADGVLRTSSHLRADRRGEEFDFSAEGANAVNFKAADRIWGRAVINPPDSPPGFAGPYAVNSDPPQHKAFFVGTKEQFDKAPKGEGGMPPPIPRLSPNKR